MIGPQVHQVERDLLDDLVLAVAEVTALGEGVSAVVVTAS